VRRCRKVLILGDIACWRDWQLLFAAEIKGKHGGEHTDPNDHAYNYSVPKRILFLLLGWRV